MISGSSSDEDDVSSAALSRLQKSSNHESSNKPPTITFKSPQIDLNRLTLNPQHPSPYNSNNNSKRNSFTHNSIKNNVQAKQYSDTKSNLSSESSDELNTSTVNSIGRQLPQPPVQINVTNRFKHGDSIKSNSHSVRSSASATQSKSKMSMPVDYRTASPSASFNSSTGSFGRGTNNNLNAEYENSDVDETELNFNEFQRRKQQQLQQQQQQQQQKDQIDNLAQQQQEKEQIELLKELEEHKKRLQIYVFVCRCIAYPFIAKQPTDMVRRQMKITKPQFQQIKDSFENFLNGKMTQIEADEAFTNAVHSYFEVFLKSERVNKIVQNGGFSALDFRDVFKNNIEKRVRSLPEIDGLSKETVLTSWTLKFDLILKNSLDEFSNVNNKSHAKNSYYYTPTTSESILTKEQLYEMFQNILGIKKFEHQVLFNAAQEFGISFKLDNADEQAATIRRELDIRMKQADNIQKQHMMPKFVHKNMESTYIEELRQSISLLMTQLDNQPVCASESKLRLPKRAHHSSKTDNMNVNDETNLTKLDVRLNFAIEVVVMEVKGLKSLSPQRIVFCVMELEGHNKLQTDQAEASRPIWDTSGDFKTQQPLPIIKVKLCMESQNLLQDNKEIGRVVIRPDPNFTRSPAWYGLEKANSKFPDELKIKLTIRFDKPQNLKISGYMEKKSEPKELMTLDNFTVDYTDVDTELKPMGGRFFYNAVKEGDSITFATEEESERQLWVQALYRATGQSHKPKPPSNVKSPQMAREQGDVDRARKHGMDEYIQADPSTFNHNSLFNTLQTLTLEYRINDPFCCMGWFSPGQIFLLDEYQARYGVRGCFRHLGYLSDLLDRAEQSYTVDPTLLHYSFAFCACHVHGNRPDGIGTVTNEEKHKFDEIKERLKHLLEYQITNFRYCFPFGRPDGALKQTLSLLERVLMKDIVTPVSLDDVKIVVRKCLENAALVNYTRTSELAKVEDVLYARSTPKKKVEDLIRLAEMCIDSLQQNEEHHAEAFGWFSELLLEHEEIFWSLFAVDMDHVIEQQLPDSWDSFPLFQLLNDYLTNHDSLRNGRFHKHLQDIFAPLVVRYVDLMESSIGQSIHKGFEKETWKCKGLGCATSEDMLWKLDALQAFIKDLHWPDEIFAEHLEHRLKQMASDMIEACASRVLRNFENAMKKGGLITGTNGADYVFSNECCVMVNIILDCKAQALKLCSLDSGDLHHYHTKIDEYLERSLNDMMKILVFKLVGVLDTILKKLSRYDEGSFFAPILSLTKPVNEIGQSYVNFLCVNLDQLRQKINDELFTLTIFERWYNEQINMISMWLSERLDISLHPYQLACLLLIVKKIRNNYELQGVTEKILDSKTYQSITTRMNVEETNQALR